MEVAMLLGLAALGYAVSTQSTAHADSSVEGQTRNPKETMANPEPTMSATDVVNVVQSETGHNNMVPFYGSKVTQSTYSGATDGILDNYTGTGDIVGKVALGIRSDNNRGAGHLYTSNAETLIFISLSGRAVAEHHLHRRLRSCGKNHRIRRAHLARPVEEDAETVERCRSKVDPARLRGW